mmetsp:Transcript_40686/g.57207  ORF Transcript_40686/g.57207 Transcript_40686/m.57207 type:complete len:345 (-) Transcript_40686:149-1183(-)
MRCHIKCKVLPHNRQSIQSNVTHLIIWNIRKRNRIHHARFAAQFVVVKYIIFVSFVSSCFRDKFISFLRSTGSLGVDDWADIRVINFMQQRCEYFPRTTKFIISNKSGMLSLEDVKNQTRVCVWVASIFEIRKEASIVIDFKFRLNGFGSKSGALHVGFHVDSFVRLHTHHEFIARTILAVEQVCSSWGIFELDTHLSLTFVKRLAGLHDERNSVPTRGVDRQLQYSKSWSVCVLVFDCGVISVSLVLPQNSILQRNRWDCVQHCDFGIANRFSRFGSLDSCWWFHGEQSQNLQEVVLQNVSNDTVLIKVSTPTVSAKWFLKCEDDTLYIFVGPHTLKPCVAET